MSYTGALEPWNHLGTWQAMGRNSSPAKKNNWKQSVFYQAKKIAWLIFQEQSSVHYNILLLNNIIWLHVKQPIKEASWEPWCVHQLQAVICPRNQIEVDVNWYEHNCISSTGNSFWKPPPWCQEIRCGIVKNFNALILNYFLFSGMEYVPWGSQLNSCLAQTAIATPM